MRAGWLVFWVSLIGNVAAAETYQVGPSAPYRQFADLPELFAGDIVEVAGGAEYEAVVFEADGAVGNPVSVRGIRVGDARPIIRGGTNTVELQGDHYVFEGFDITGGSARCLYHHADDIVVRDVVIHDCPQHGLLGADEDSGSLLFEYSEIYRTGSGDRYHQVYMSTDQIAHPGSVFRMQFCYIHDGNGGNGVKSRAQRNEIYYNWIENSFFHELELIGPDPGGTPVEEDANVENSDVVGNVFVSLRYYTARFGGDATGQTNGRYRFLFNTVILGPDSPGVFRLFDGIESLEAHNNVIFYRGGGDPQVLRDVDADWVGGTRRVAGSTNWVVSGTALRNLPSEWTGTIRGADPSFEGVDVNDYRPALGSPLIDVADPSPTPFPGYAFPSPEVVPRFQPPPRAPLPVGGAVPRPMAGDALDLGALEFGSGPPVMSPDAGPGGGLDAGTCTPNCGGRECGDNGCGGICGSCLATEQCDGAGMCACTDAECDGACVDPASDPDHCGGCNTVCGDTEVCSESACADSCRGGLTACERACVDTSDDVLHCGACGNACDREETCVTGVCRDASMMSRGGCGCRTGVRKSARAALFLAGLSLGFLLVRRRSRIARG